MDTLKFIYSCLDEYLDYLYLLAMSTMLLYIFVTVVIGKWKDELERHDESLGCFLSRSLETTLLV